MILTAVVLFFCSLSALQAMPDGQSLIGMYNKNKTLHTLLATAVAAVTESATRAVGRCNWMARICPAELLFYFYYYLLLFILFYFIILFFSATDKIWMSDIMFRLFVSGFLSAGRTYIAQRYETEQDTCRFPQHSLLVRRFAYIEEQLFGVIRNPVLSIT